MKSICLLLVVIVGLSCGSRDQRASDRDGLKVLRFFENEVIKVNKWSEILDTLIVIPLETHPDGLLNKISKVQICDSSIVIHDKGKRSTIFLFSINGKFIQQLGSHGKGPGEYIYPVDFQINEASKEIWLVDGPSMQLHKYTLNGFWKESVKLHQPVRTFDLLPDKWIVFETMGEHLLGIMNSEGETVKSFFIREPGTDKGFPRSLDRFHDQVGYFKNLDDTIYRVNQAGAFPYLLMDFGMYSEEIPSLFCYTESE